MYEGSRSLHHHQLLLFYIFLIIPILVGVHWYHIVVLICTSLRTNEHLLTCFLFFSQQPFEVALISIWQQGKEIQR